MNQSYKLTSLSNALSSTKADVQSRYLTTFKDRNSMSKDQILEGIRRAKRTLPEMAAIAEPDENTMIWIGQTKAVLANVGVSINSDVNSVQSYYETDNTSLLDTAIASYRDIQQTLINAITKLEFEVGSYSAAIEQGNVLDYFSESRRIVESAQTEIFLIDPYTDADIVTDYFKMVNPPINIRVLTSNKQRGLDSIIPAAKMLHEQTGAHIEIRSADHLHDRFWLIDGTHGYSSSSSIKDGGRKSAAVILEVRDTFDPIQSSYESKWSAAKLQSKNPED